MGTRERGGVHDTTSDSSHSIGTWAAAEGMECVTGEI